MSVEKEVEEVFARDPILYLDLGVVEQLRDQKQVARDVQAAQDSKKIITETMLQEIEDRIRQGTRIAGDPEVIAEVRIRLLRMQEDKKREETYSPLTEDDLKEYLQVAGSIHENENGPQAARDAFEVGEQTKVLVATLNKTKFDGQDNVEAFQFGGEGGSGDAWNRIVKEFDKAKDETLIRNMIGGFTISGRGMDIAGLLGPPLQVELMKKRSIDEVIRAQREKQKGKGGSEAEIERKQKEAQDRSQGAGKSFGVIFLQATDKDGNPIRSRNGDPVLDMIEMENGRVRNVIINDPDGRRQGDGIRVKAYNAKQFQEGALDQLVKNYDSPDFAQKAIRNEFQGLLGSVEPQSQGIDKSPWVSNQVLGEELDQYLGAVVKAIGDQKGQEVDENQLLPFMKADSGLSIDERLVEFTEVLNSLGEESKNELKEESAAIKVDAHGNVSIDTEKFLQELAQIANEGMMLNAGLAGVVTRSRALGAELDKKIREQETDLDVIEITQGHNATVAKMQDRINDFDKKFGNQLLAGAKQKATEAGHGLVSAGAQLVPGQSAQLPKDGRHLKTPQPAAKPGSGRPQAKIDPMSGV